MKQRQQRRAVRELWLGRSVLTGASTYRAAQILGLHTSTVDAALRSGALRPLVKIEGKNGAYRFAISFEEIERFRAETVKRYMLTGTDEGRARAERIRKLAPRH